MLKKPEIVVLTKTDMISKEEGDKKLKLLKEIGSDVFSISLLDDESIKDFQDALKIK
jgi:ethanolamine utilization protein EutP (predicted NTPase)